MAAPLPAPLFAEGMWLCRHCDQPLHHRPDPSPSDPDSTDSWWSREDDGSLTSACHGADAVQFDCPGCWGMGVDSDGVDCESCDATGRRADHTPTQVEALSPDARLLSPKSPEADLLAAANLAQAVGAVDVAAPLLEQAREKALERQRARKLRDVYAATADDGAM